MSLRYSLVGLNPSSSVTRSLFGSVSSTVNVPAPSCLSKGDPEVEESRILALAPSIDLPTQGIFQGPRGRLTSSSSKCWGVQLWSSGGKQERLHSSPAPPASWHMLFLSIAASGTRYRVGLKGTRLSQSDRGEDTCADLTEKHCQTQGAKAHLGAGHKLQHIQRMAACSQLQRSGKAS